MERTAAEWVYESCGGARTAGIASSIPQDQNKDQAADSIK